MIVRSVAVSLVSLALGGCVYAPSTLPPMPKGRDALLPVIAHVRCEIGKAYNVLKTQYAGIDLLRAKFELSMAVEVSGGADLGSSVFGRTSRFVPAIAATAGYSGAATTTSQLKFTIDLKDSSTLECAVKKADSGHSAPNNPNIRGNLRIYHWMDATLQALALNGGVSQFESAGQTIFFVLDYGGSLDPSFVITRIDGGRRLGNSLLSLNRKETNSLKVAIARADPKEPSDGPVQRKLDEQLNTLSIQELGQTIDRQRR